MLLQSLTGSQRQRRILSDCADADESLVPTSPGSSLRGQLIADTYRVQSPAPHGSVSVRAMASAFETNFGRALHTDALITRFSGRSPGRSKRGNLVGDIGGSAALIAYEAACNPEADGPSVDSSELLTPRKIERSSCARSSYQSRPKSDCLLLRACRPPVLPHRLRRSLTRKPPT